MIPCRLHAMAPLHLPILPLLNKKELSTNLPRVASLQHILSSLNPAEAAREKHREKVLLDILRFLA